MNETISHIGVVDKVFQNQIHVSIVSQTACSACHAKGACGVDSESQKLIHVACSETQSYSVGQKVQVFISEKTALLAVMYAYILPCIVVCLALVASSYFVGEILAVLISFILLALYFIVLSKYKSVLHKKISFHLAHIA